MKDGDVIRAEVASWFEREREEERLCVDSIMSLYRKLQKLCEQNDNATVGMRRMVAITHIRHEVEKL